MPKTKEEKNNIRYPRPNPNSRRNCRKSTSTGSTSKSNCTLVFFKFCSNSTVLYAYDCYNVEITNPKYNTFTKVPQCPPDLTCYCGLAFNTNEELSLHVSSVHKDKVYKCSTCGTQCNNKRATWKHFRSQHLYIHTHHCTISSCQFGKNNKPYGNDDQCLVWMYMEKKPSLKLPLGCPKCTKTFSSPKYQIPHIKNKHDLAPKKTKTIWLHPMF